MTEFATTLAFLGNLRGADLLIIALFALLIFGRRLPEIGRNIGKTFVEFKKGLKSSDEETEATEEEGPKRKTLSSKASKRIKAANDEP